MQKREQRQQVMLQVRMRSDAGWSDVVLRNVSRRGMLISSNLPVKRGTCIEIRRAHHTIVARIMWSAGGRFGARTQDPIDIAGLIGAATVAQAGRTMDQASARWPGLPERRRASRPEQSRSRSARLQFLTLATAGAVAALLIAEEVGASLAVPFAAVRAALAG